MEIVKSSQFISLGLLGLILLNLSIYYYFKYKYRQPKVVSVKKAKTSDRILDELLDVSHPYINELVDTFLDNVTLNANSFYTRLNSTDMAEFICLHIYRYRKNILPNISSHIIKDRLNTLRPELVDYFNLKSELNKTGMIENIIEAFKMKKRVEITHTSHFMTINQPNQKRDVEVYDVDYENRRFAAYCYVREQILTFKFERLQKVKIKSDFQYNIPKTFDKKAYWESYEIVHNSASLENLSF